jgi:hypothetical protein
MNIVRAVDVKDKLVEKGYELYSPDELEFPNPEPVIPNMPIIRGRESMSIPTEPKSCFPESLFL